MKKLTKALILCAYLCLIGAVLTACSYRSADSGVTECDKYDDAERYIAASEFTYDGAAVSKVNVNWIIGEVKLTQTAGSELRVKESGQFDEEEKKMRYLIDGDVLNVMFWQSEYSATVKNEEKKLSIEIPMNVDLKVTCVSAPFTAGDLQLKDAKISSIGGAVTIGNLTAEEVKIKSISGLIKTGDIVSRTDIAMENVSGSVEINKVAASELSAETISGNIIISGFSVSEKASLKSVSGAIKLKDVITKTVEAKNTSGAVRIKVASSYAVNADYETTSGVVEFGDKVYEKRKLDGVTFGAGAKEVYINVSTVSGAIDVQ